MRRRLAGALVLLLALPLVTSGCGIAERANGTTPPPVQPTTVLPTAVAPPQAEGLDGTTGAPGPQVCTAIARPLATRLEHPVTARPMAWNDGGLPSMDLCMLLVDGRPVTIGVSALPSRPDSLVRLMNGAGGVDSLPELGPEALIGESRLVFHAAGHAVRVTPAGGIDIGTPDGVNRATAVAIAEAARDAVPHVLRPVRQVDETCQLSNSAAERFVRVRVQLRRDYRVKGALTCIWGTPGATVSIVEAFDQKTIPEAEQVPPPQFAPLGDPGYYLPESAELVFCQGRRVVRVAALTDPPQAVTLDTLTTLVDPMLPLFLR
ncbi:hypothetical protein [Kribbella sp.]|uniref:hypothetical protein n=1 Tax=Kribbella sp. TaxID=1871183 RepID=UPI002D57DEA6|nr:hypothetical protein [Kribbella sp.]HZX07311.1 hypothetical protein [Kribbella sp.]